MTIFTLLRQQLVQSGRTILLLAALIALSNLLLLVLIHYVVEASNEALLHLLLLYLLGLLFWLISSHQFQRLIVRLIANTVSMIRLRLIDELQQVTLSSYQRSVSREALYTTLGYDIEAIAHGLNAITRTIHASVLILSTLIYLALVSQPILLLTLLVTLVGLLIYLYTQRLRSAALEQMRAHEQALFASLDHLLYGNRELKLDPQRQRHFFRDRFNGALDRLHRWRLRQSRLQVVQQLLAIATWSLLFFGLLLLAPQLPEQLTPTEILKGIGILLFMPWEVLLDGINRSEQARISLMKLREFEQHLKSLPQTPHPITQRQQPVLQLRTQPLQCERLRFSYYDQNQTPLFTLGPIDLALHSRQIHFVTGSNGSGKTTLLQLIGGVLQPDQGGIRLNGELLTPQQLQRLSYTVFADAHLFDRPYGQSIDQRALERGLKRLELDKKTQFVDGRFSTIALSTGQRKRLALLLAMLSPKPLLLLDEWSAEQDPRFRDLFYRELLPELKRQGRTLLVITHDDDHFDAADRIIQLDGGTLQV